MAKWRLVTTRYEPPEWYRCFHPEDWDEPDSEEIRLTAGLPGDMLPYLHDHHSRRRWHEAKHEYRRQHPEFGSQEVRDLIESHQWRRAGG